MGIVDQHGNSIWRDPPADGPCRHERACPNGFDVEAARAVLDSWVPNNKMTGRERVIAFVMGNPKAAEVRKRWPRGSRCPDCGETGIFYASAEHYAMGDW